MERRKLPKRVARLLWVLAVAWVVFAGIRLRPLLLIRAVHSGNVPLARFALKTGVSPNIVTSGEDADDVFNLLLGSDQFGGIPRPALVAAVGERSSGVVRLLLDAGADPNQGDGAGPPLLYAAVGGDAECIELLLHHGADPNGHYKDNTSVLDSLPFPPDPQIVALLRKAGAKG